MTGDGIGCGFVEAMVERRNGSVVDPIDCWAVGNEVGLECFTWNLGICYLKEGKTGQESDDSARTLSCAAEPGKL